MRSMLALVPLLFFLCGCATTNKNAGAWSRKLIVTPDKTLVGKVAWVNNGGRFVVLNFPLGQLPAPEQRLSLYRGGLKVGEVKVTGLQNDDNFVADILTGDSQVGDEARNR